MFVKEINGLELIKDEQDGYSFRSKKTGATYDLLEGKSYKGTSTSDIIFIMRGEEDKGYTNLVNFCFGACFLDDTLMNCADYINDYENGAVTDLSIRLSD